jgi:hypothetical protein
VNALLSAKPPARHNVDTRSLPEWGRAHDGKSVRLVADDQLRAAYVAWEAAECDHADLVIHKRINAAGAEMYKQMCRGCGLGIGDWIKHASLTGATVSTDPLERFENISNRYTDRRFSELEEIADGAAERQQPERRGEYSGYLASEGWARKRVLILKRAGGTCEGCLSRPATEVHHLTYTHVGAEFAFELVALCAACHERLHNTASAR